MTVGEKEGWKRKMRGEGEVGEELEGTGYLRWRKNRDESKERDILIEGVIYRGSKKPGTREIPRNPQA